MLCNIGPSPPPLTSSTGFQQGEAARGGGTRGAPPKWMGKAWGQLRARRAGAARELPAASAWRSHVPPCTSQHHQAACSRFRARAQNLHLQLVFIRLQYFMGGEVGGGLMLRPLMLAAELPFKAFGLIIILCPTSGHVRTPTSRVCNCFSPSPHT